jgi:hypothetical protein
LFTDVTQISGLASSSLAWVGFGTVFFDYDNDGDLDIVVANGHIIDNIELFDPVRSHAQPGEFRQGHLHRYLHRPRAHRQTGGPGCCRR